MTPDSGNFSEHDERLNEIMAAYVQAIEAGRPADRQEILDQHPDFASELAAFFADYDRLRQLAAPLRDVAQAAQAGLAVSADATQELSQATTAGAASTSDAQTQSLNGSASPPPAGTHVRYFGDYELLQEIARGGMGVVYKARQMSLTRPVALKMILAGPHASSSDIQRFRNEAEAVANLDHPNIVPIYEVGLHEGHSYFSMKLIDGGSLAALLSEFTADPRSAARLMISVARAVHHAHQRGVLHRDLKPSNILIDRAGLPHVSDFGLAKRVESDSELTQSGAILGSPPYMAPEQTTGRRGAVTTATDVYGLGAVLYATLTGRPPFQADSVMDTLEQVRQRAPEPPSGVNHKVERDLQTICLKCLDKEPQRRYASALELAEDLDRWLSGRPILARRAGLPERAWRWAHRNPAVAALSALAVLMMLGGMTGLAISNAMISRRNAVVVRQRDEIRKALGDSEEARAQADAVSKFLVEAFRKPDPEQDGRDVKVMDVLDQAAASLEEESAGSPKIQGKLLNALGQTYFGLGLPDRAAELFTKARSVREATLGAEDVDTLESCNGLAAAYLAQGRTPEAIALHEEILKLRADKLGRDHPDTLTSMNNLAAAYQDAGKLDLAMPLFEQL